MNLVQPEGQEGEEEEEGDDAGGEGGGDMEPPPDSAVGERSGKEAAGEPVPVGCLLKGGEDDDEDDARSSCGHPSLEQNLSPELQQGYRILSEFLLEKHHLLTAPFLRPSGGQKTEDGQSSTSLQETGGNQPSQDPQHLSGMWLLKMEEKFSTGQYKGIADFVADFRLMLETCYRLHGVDHWLSKQAQKLEMMLEQKLALLSR